MPDQPQVPEEIKAALRELDRQVARAEKAEAALQEAEDRFEFCDNCERPAREGDLKVVWCREPESGEQVDARICAVCRAEAALAGVRGAVNREIKHAGTLGASSARRILAALDSTKGEGDEAEGGEAR